MKSEEPQVQTLSNYRAKRVDRVASSMRKYASGEYRRASLRVLPPPFDGWCSISSDADSPNMQGFLSVGAQMREHFALPVSDSIFPHYIFNQGLIAESKNQQGFADFGVGKEFDFETFLTNAGLWLRQVYQGRTDTIHGWLLRQQVRIGDDAVLGPRTQQQKPPSEGPISRQVNRIKSRLPQTKHRIVFRSPPGWHTRVPPQYFVFKFRAPTHANKIVLCFMDGAEKVSEVDLTALPGGAPEILLPYVIDLHEAVGSDADLLKNLEVEIRLSNSAGVVEVREPAMISWLREDIKEQMTLFEALNIKLTAYTSHGGGFNIGHHKSVSSDAADPRGMADDPDSPFFSMDLFQHFGLRFFNTANNTSQPNTVSLSDFIFEKTANDGKTLYDFNRFNYVPLDGDGQRDYSPFRAFGKEQNPSMANFAGWQIDTLIDSIDADKRAHQGGVVYTHLLSKCLDDPSRTDRSADAIFNQPTREGLDRLSRSYYGIPTDRSPNDKRIFVAPQANLLRYAQMQLQLNEAAVYDEENNSVHINSWTDSVTSEELPSDAGGSNALRYCTFYVRDAASARLFVDGKEHHALIRNAEDGGQGQSITVADAGVPTPILGNVRLQNRADISVSTHGCRLSQDDRGQSGAVHSLSIEKQQAAISITCTNLCLADHNSVRVVLEGDLTGADWSLELNGQDDEKLGITTTADARRPHHRHIIAGPNANLHDIVVPFYHMTAEAPDAGLPCWRVADIILTISGAQGRTISIRRIDLLKDDPRVRTDRCIVGGHADTTLQLSKVIMTIDGDSFEAKVTKSGWFIFLDKIPRGTIVSLRGQGIDGSQDHLPDCGEHHEVTGDTLDINFTSS